MLKSKRLKATKKKKESRKGTAKQKIMAVTKKDFPKTKKILLTADFMAAERLSNATYPEHMQALHPNGSPNAWAAVRRRIEIPFSTDDGN